MTGVLHVAVVMKSTDGNFAFNALKHGVAGLNIDGCRIGTETITQHGRKETFSQSMSGKNYAQEAGTNEHQGRWPANVVHDGSDEVLAGFPVSNVQARRNNPEKMSGGAGMFGIAKRQKMGPEYLGDTGSASRFFFQVKEFEE